MKCRIKICGLFREEDIDYANALKPDFIGFVFAESRRRVGRSKAAALKKRLDSDIKAAGVFVNASMEFILDLLNQSVIDTVQLHGNEDSGFIDNLKRRTCAAVIKSVPVTDSLSIMEYNDSPADMLLLDNAKGGSGEPFDKKYLSDALSRGFKRDFFLAGGINRDNIKHALEFNPFGIDVSSGAETGGFKDYDKMKEIINIVRNEI